MKQSLRSWLQVPLVSLGASMVFTLLNTLLTNFAYNQLYTVLRLDHYRPIFWITSAFSFAVSAILITVSGMLFFRGQNRREVMRSALICCGYLLVYYLLLMGINFWLLQFGPAEQAYSNAVLLLNIFKIPVSVFVGLAGVFNLVLLLPYAENWYYVLYITFAAIPLIYGLFAKKQPGDNGDELEPHIDR